MVLCVYLPTRQCNTCWYNFVLSNERFLQFQMVDACRCKNKLFIYFQLKTFTLNVYITNNRLINTCYFRFICSIIARIINTRRWLCDGHPRRWKHFTKMPFHRTTPNGKRVLVLLGTLLRYKVWKRGHRRWFALLKLQVITCSLLSSLFFLSLFIYKPNYSSLFVPCILQVVTLQLCR